MYKPLWFLHRELLLLKRKKWLNALSRYNKSKDLKFINQFIIKNGHPAKFLIKEDKSTSLDPIIFSSRCDYHKKLNIVEATLFLNSLPKANEMKFSKLKTKQQEYSLPYQTRTLGFKNNKPIVILEDNNILYTTLISNDFKFKIIELSENEINELIENKETINCKSNIKKNDYFASNDCYKVWDLNKKKQIEVSQDWSCL